jgi:putative lipoprotein
VTGPIAAALAVLVATIVTPPPGQGGKAAPSAITGTITGSAGTTLPAGALVRVWLETEPSRHQPARRVAETTFPGAGRRFPISFTLAYPPEGVDPAGRYQLRCLISLDKRVLFFARFGRPVALDSSSPKMEIPVEAFGGKKLQVTTISGSVGLSGAWVLTALPDQPAALGTGAAAPTLEIDGPSKRISGSTGCNQYFGTAVVESGSALSLDPSGMTRMACPDAVTAVEDAFLAALRATTSYGIRGVTLELRAGDRVLARFERPRAAKPSD